MRSLLLLHHPKCIIVWGFALLCSMVHGSEVFVIITISIIRFGAISYHDRKTYSGHSQSFVWIDTDWSSQIFRVVALTCFHHDAVGAASCICYWYELYLPSRNWMELGLAWRRCVASVAIETTSSGRSRILVFSLMMHVRESVQSNVPKLNGFSSWFCILAFCIFRESVKRSTSDCIYAFGQFVHHNKQWFSSTLESWKLIVHFVLIICNH